MNRLKTITMKREMPSDKMLDDYLNGRLSPKEMWEVEAAAADNPLLADALEGMASHGNAGFAALDNKMQAKFSGGTSAFNMLWASMFVALAVIGGAGIVNELSSSETAEIVKTEQEQNAAMDQEQEEVKLETLTDELIDKEMEALENEAELPLPIQIDAQKTLNNQAQPDPEVEVEILPMRDTVDIKPQEVELIDIQPEKPAVKSNVKLLYMYYFKTVDYAKLFDRKIKVRNMDFDPGTRVYHESRQESEPEIMSPYIEVDYTEFLEEAMLAFSKNDYKAALKDFKIILKHYPDDVNAHFYGGLCYFNLGKMDRAEAYFLFAERNGINTFDEEAKYYRAQVYMQDKKWEKAKKVLKQIIDDNGFYTKAAKTLLKECK